MKTLVMKFGGAAVATPQQYCHIADLVISRRQEYSRIVVVVSAMGGTTDQLIELAKQVHPHPPQREYDMLISVGERISMTLLAMALCLKGQEAMSFTGSQSGIMTCGNHAQAQIIDVRPQRLEASLQQGKIVIVAGFQGVSLDKEITTLGRGGSDTTAVALGLALRAEKVEFFKDVPGLFSKDPKIHPEAELYSVIHYQEALDIVNRGAKILHARALQLALKNKLPLQIRSFNPSHREHPGTLIHEAGSERRGKPIFENPGFAVGMHSEFFGHRLLERKGSPADDRMEYVQAYLASLVKRFPQVYDTDISISMQHLLVTSRDDFKGSRHPRHLGRIICIKHLFRKGLREAMKKNPQRRHINLKLFRAFIQKEGARKPVLGIFAGVNLLRDQENFGERHLLRAIQHIIPAAVAIENSLYHHRNDAENICFTYIEIEKRDGSPITGAEIRKLRRELPGNIKNRIEHRLHNVFMPRNEEEVMRNILILTNQIKYVRDVPQVMINFDEQAYAHLYFTVILARLMKTESPSVADLFKRSDSGLEYLHDRTKVTGFVRKKYPKEATVFRLKLPKEGFLRADQSIDLYKARQLIVKELSKVMGEIRDYNGGMISKQHELLLDIRKSLSDTNYDELLLENFFYSLAPVVACALIDPEAFKTLFLMLLEGIKEFRHEGNYLKFQHSPKTVFALIIVEDIAVKESIQRAVHDLQIPAAELPTTHVKTQGNICLGYICNVKDPEKREQFVQAINQMVNH